MEIKCETCVKADVCKLVDEMRKNIEDIENAIRLPDDFVSELNCIHYVYNHPVSRNTPAPINL